MNITEISAYTCLGRDSNSEYHEYKTDVLTIILVTFPLQLEVLLCLSSTGGNTTLSLSFRIECSNTSCSRSVARKGGPPPQHSLCLLYVTS
jgi:hypothetical protein